MTNEQPWTNSPSVLNYARVLRAVVANDSRLGTVEAHAVAERLDITPEAVGAAFDSLAREGLVLAPQGAQSVGFIEDVVARPGAQARVHAWDAAATRSALRRACESAVLTWLDSADGDNAPSMNEFTGTTGAYFFGEPFPNEIVLAAIRSLLDHGLIEGDQRARLLLKPRLTADGHVAVERFGADVVAWVAGPETGGGAYVSVRDSPGANVSQQSPNSQQRSHVEVSASDGLERLAAALETMLSTSAEALELEPADLARAYALVPELKAAAEDVDQDPGRALQALSVLGDITKAGTGSVLGSALWALALQVPLSLG